MTSAHNEVAHLAVLEMSERNGKVRSAFTADRADGKDGVSSGDRTSALRAKSTYVLNNILSYI